MGPKAFSSFSEHAHRPLQAEQSAGFSQQAEINTPATGKQGTTTFGEDTGPGGNQSGEKRTTVSGSFPYHSRRTAGMNRTGDDNGS